MPSLLTLAVLITAGMLLGPDRTHSCPDGMTDKGAGICVRAGTD
ncbi:hypothetical protein [Prauserella halophila]|nr:hypothetical protein [Prauserella halophila]